jgi:hypothetical protein
VPVSESPEEISAKEEKAREEARAKEIKEKV